MPRYEIAFYLVPGPDKSFFSGETIHPQPREWRIEETADTPEQAREQAMVRIRKTAAAWNGKAMVYEPREIH